MFDITINEKKYKIPTSFADITMDDYIRCFAGIQDTKGKEGADLFYTVRKNESIIISRLLGEDDDFCMNMPIVIYQELSEACRFIYDIKSIEHVNSIVIDGEKWEIPEIEQFNLRQWIDIDVTLQDDGDDNKFLNLLSMLLLKRGEDGKLIPYDGERSELAEKVKKMKASDGLGIIYHFFLQGEISKKITKCFSAMEAVTHRFRRNTANS